MSDQDMVRDAPPGPIGAHAATHVGIGSMMSAAVGFVVLWFGARSLSLADNSLFIVAISVLMACYGVLSGVSLELTRSVATARKDCARGPRVLTLATSIAIVFGGTIAATSPWWKDRIFSDQSTLLSLLIAGGVLSYTFHAALVGALSGENRWSGVAFLFGLEALVRLGLTSLVFVVAASVASYVVAVVLATSSWLFLTLLSGRARAAWQERTDQPTTKIAARIAASVIGQGSSALLVVGFPMLLGLTTDSTELRAAAPLMTAISLTRAPLLIPLNAYQGVAVAYFVHSKDSAILVLARIYAVILGVGLVGAGLAWALGPWIMGWFGAEYRLSGSTLALLTMAAALLAILTITGTVIQAFDDHLWFLMGWIVSTASVVLLLLLPGDLTTRAVRALLLGPLIGTILPLVRLAQHHRPQAAQ